MKAIVLLFVIALAAVASAKRYSTYRNYAGLAPPRPFGVAPGGAKLYSHSYRVVDNDGIVTQLDYNATVDARVFSPNADQEITAITCAASTLTVTLVNDASAAQHATLWSTGKPVMVAGEEWDCLNADGHAAPFFRQINAAQQQGSTVVLQTEDIEIGDLTNLTDFQFSTDRVRGPIQAADAPYAMGLRGKRKASNEVEALFSFNYDKASGRAEQVFSYDKTLHWGDVTADANIACTNCYAFLDLGLNMKLSTRWFKVKEFLVDVTGKAVINLEAMLRLNGQFDLKDDFTVMDDALAKLPWPAVISFYIGPIPIQIRFKLPIKAGYNTHADADATFKASFRAEEDVTWGTDWTSSSGWTPIARYSNSCSYSIPDFSDIHLNGNADTYIRPELQVSHDHLIILKASLGTEPHVKADVHYPARGGECKAVERLHYDATTHVDVDWKFSAEIDAVVGKWGPKEWSGKLYDSPNWELLKGCLPNNQTPGTEC